MMPTKKHTLEKIVDSLGKKYDEESMHAALLLSYAESIYSVVNRNCVPCPLYRITYDEKNNIVGMDETQGLSLPPEQGALDISVLDEIFCCNIRDIPLLMEGETGVGKTFAAIKYLSAVFEKNQFFSHRLSANAFLNNLFSHFQEGKMAQGMPVIEANVARIESTGGCIEDEINRGDSNETLQLFDNEMHLGGAIYKLGLHIPEFDDKTGEYKSQSGRKKKLVIVSAQNPAGNEDVKFTQTMQLDAAVDNRLLKIYVGNSAPSVGSTLWLGDEKGKLHDLFLEDFVKRASMYLGTNASVFSDLKDDWLSTYAWITEAEKTNKPILYSALELSDIMIGIFSGNLIDYYNYEKKVINLWNKKLKKSVEITDALQETDNIKGLHEVIYSFKVPIIFRDIIQIKKIADVLSTLKNVKDALVDKEPVKKYMNTKQYVTVREVAGAVSLLARNKQKSSAQAPINAINQVLTQYVSLIQEYMKDAGSFGSFSLYDENASIKRIALRRGLRETITHSGGVDYAIDRLSEEANTLTSKISASEDIKNIIIARSVADIMTLCGFLNQYKNKLNPLIKKFSKPIEDINVVKELRSFYYEQQRQSAMVMPEIYQHRIQRTLGV